ncbi:MAG: PadR family transcriptional regulator [Gaiellales bacterium]
MNEPRGHLDLLVLATLDEGPAHGYLVMERLRGRSAGTFDFPEGSVYPALHRLEERGLLRSAWSAETGRKRRTYELTRRGRVTLSAEAKEWRRFAGAIDAVLTGVT